MIAFSLRLGRSGGRVCAHRARPHCALPALSGAGATRQSETSARPRRGRARPAPYPDTLAITPTFLRVPRLSLGPGTPQPNHSPAARVGPPLGEGATRGRSSTPTYMRGAGVPPESRGGGPSPHRGRHTSQGWGGDWGDPRVIPARAADRVPARRDPHEGSYSQWDVSATGKGCLTSLRPR